MPYTKYDGTPASPTGDGSVHYGNGQLAETLVGTAASETFWISEGDKVSGGGGDDTYYLQTEHGKYSITEAAAGGIDKVAGWQNITLERYKNVENVSVSGDGLYAAGNHLDNVVEGGAGSQQIYGGLGQDVLVGGAGKDVFIVYKGEGNDVIQDFTAEDILRLKAGFTSFDQVKAAMSQIGSDVKIDFGGGDGLILRNTTVGQYSAANFQLQLDYGSLGAKVFGDEFNGPLSIWDPESNPTGTWRPDLGYQGTQGYGSYTIAGNNELQIYTSPYFRDHPGDFAESPFVSNADGTMSIWAKPSTNAEIFGYGYTSGMITSKQSFTATYGYFEMRADVPMAAGAWPAFWLIPVSGRWPPELDIMEVLSKDPWANYATQHSGVGGHSSAGNMSYLPGDGMHTYGALWSPTDLVWYYDGVEVFRSATPSDMHEPMYILANMALGGWGGVVDNSQLPAEFKIDYIRAYALPGSTSGPTPQPAPPPTASYQNSLFSLADSGAHTKTITGGTKRDNLTGTSGNDLIDGKGNSDTLTGGGGDDTYVVDRADDKVVEAAGAGIDTVRSTASAYSLSSNVEHIRLVGSGGQSATGNELNNILTSNDWGSTLSGGAGNDILVAGRGADVLTGGAGKDIFDFDRLPTKAGRITDFTLGEDMLDLRGLFAAVGYKGSDPVADAYLQFKSDGAGGTAVYFDSDGLGSAGATLVTVLEKVAPSKLFAQNDWFFA